MTGIHLHPTPWVKSRTVTQFVTTVKPRAVFSLKTGKLETADRKPRNAGTWPQKMQSLSKHGCFAYLENLGSSGPRRGADRCRLAGFAATNGDRIASLSLLCPTALDPRAATPMAPRLLVIAGDRGAAAERVRTASASMG